METEKAYVGALLDKTMNLTQSSTSVSTPASTPKPIKLRNACNQCFSAKVCATPNMSNAQHGGSAVTDQSVTGPM